MCHVIVKRHNRLCSECPFLKEVKTPKGPSIYCMAKTSREEADPKTAYKCPLE